METKGSQESLQSRLSFFHHGRLFSSDRDDSSDSDDYLETGLNSAFCQFVIEFLSRTLHVTRESSIVKSLITQAWIKCNTFPALG